MEQTNVQVEAKKLWNIVRVMFYMLRKGISKRKHMLDLNMMMKRGKIAGKAIHNLMFHMTQKKKKNLMFHHHHSSALSYTGGHTRDYEFSCSNTPAFSFHHTKRKHHHHSHFFGCAHAPPTLDDDVMTVNAVTKALEMFNSGGASSPDLSTFLQSPMVREMVYSELPSPALPVLGRSPAVRQLRVTDSPFPLREVDSDCHVDLAAEEFITKFYQDLRKQNKMVSF